MNAVQFQKSGSRYRELPEALEEIGGVRLSGAREVSARVEE